MPFIGLLSIILFVSTSALYGHGGPCEAQLIATWNIMSVMSTRIYPGGILRSRRVLFATHASEYWNKQRVGGPEQNRIIRKALESGIPTVYLIHGLRTGELLQYYLQFQPTYTYLSSGGGHDIQLETEEVCLTGGAFSLCLGETARDSILFGRFSKAARLTFYSRAIYGTFNDSPTMATLHSQIAVLRGHELVEWTRKNLFTRSLAFGKQNTEERCATALDHRFDILMNGQKQGMIESRCRNPQLPRRIVELNFVTEEEAF